MKRNPSLQNWVINKVIPCWSLNSSRGDDLNLTHAQTQPTPKPRGFLHFYWSSPLLACVTQPASIVEIPACKGRPHTVCPDTPPQTEVQNSCQHREDFRDLNLLQHLPRLQPSRVHPTGDHRLYEDPVEETGSTLSTGYFGPFNIVSIKYTLFISSASFIRRSENCRRNSASYNTKKIVSFTSQI